MKEKPVSHRVLKYLKHTDEQPSQYLTIVNILFPTAVQPEKFQLYTKNKNKTNKKIQNK